MEVLNLIRYFGGGFSLTLHTAYIGEDSSIWMVPEMFGDNLTKENLMGFASTWMSQEVSKWSVSGL